MQSLKWKLTLVSVISISQQGLDGSDAWRSSPVQLLTGQSSDLGQGRGSCSCPAPSQDPQGPQLDLERKRRLPL